MFYYYLFFCISRYIHCIKKTCTHNPTLESDLPKPNTTLETYNPFLFPQQEAFTLIPSAFPKPAQVKTATILNQFASLFLMLHTCESASNMYRTTSYLNSAKFSLSLENLSPFSLSPSSL